MNTAPIKEHNRLIEKYVSVRTCQRHLIYAPCSQRTLVGRRLTVAHQFCPCVYEEEVGGSIMLGTKLNRGMFLYDVELMHFFHSAFVAGVTMMSFSRVHISEKSFCWAGESDLKNAVISLRIIGCSCKCRDARRSTSWQDWIGWSHSLNVAWQNPAPELSSFTAFSSMSSSYLSTA